MSQDTFPAMFASAPSSFLLPCLRTYKHGERRRNIVLNFLYFLSLFFFPLFLCFSRVFDFVMIWLIFAGFFYSGCIISIRCDVHTICVIVSHHGNCCPSWPWLLRGFSPVSPVTLPFHLFAWILYFGFVATRLLPLLLLFLLAIFYFLSYFLSFLLHLFLPVYFFLICSSSLFSFLLQPLLHHLLLPPTFFCCSTPPLPPTFTWLGRIGTREGVTQKNLSGLLPVRDFRLDPSLLYSLPLLALSPNLLVVWIFLSVAYFLAKLRCSWTATSCSLCWERLAENTVPRLWGGVGKPLTLMLYSMYKLPHPDPGLYAKPPHLSTAKPRLSFWFCLYQHRYYDLLFETALDVHTVSDCSALFFIRWQQNTKKHKVTVLQISETPCCEYV